MLYNRKNTFFWSIQIFSWLALFAIIAITNYLSGINITNTTYIINLIIWILSSIVITSLLRYYIKKKSIYELRIKKRILFILSAAVISSGLTSLITVRAYTIFANESINFIENFINIGVTMFFIYLFWLILYFSFKLFETNQEQKNLATKLQLEKTNFELQALKQQLNPHFLFNSLNSIRALILEDSSRARNAVTQLSNLLRTTLISGNKNLITIGEEIKLVENYLELEKIRYDDKLQYNINCNSSSALIPPFIIQLLVENAIKYGVSKNKSGGYVNINVFETNEETTIKVENNGTWDNSDSDTKIGVNNIKKRLELTFNKNTSYNVTSKKNMVTTTIKVSKR